MDNLISHDIVRGLVYTHNRTNANTAEVHGTATTLDALVRLLVERGLVDPEELAAAKQQAAERLRKEYVERGMAVASQEFGVSKYEFQGGAGVDCEACIHVCKAACCRLPLALSKEDVQEGIVRWDFGQPYIIARGRDGYCVHLDRKTFHCTIYGNRPIPCRGYDCSKDERIWLDFGDKVINPRMDEPDWPECMEMEAVTVADGRD